MADLHGTGSVSARPEQELSAVPMGALRAVRGIAITRRLESDQKHHGPPSADPFLAALDRQLCLARFHIPRPAIPLASFATAELQGACGMCCLRMCGEVQTRIWCSYPTGRSCWTDLDEPLKRRFKWSVFERLRKELPDPYGAGTIISDWTRLGQHPFAPMLEARAEEGVKKQGQVVLEDYWNAERPHLRFEAALLIHLASSFPNGPHSSRSAGPGSRCAPGSPESPVTPGSPWAPVAPGSPESPVTLASSWAPLAPGSPESPVTRGSPWAPLAPGSPVTPRSRSHAVAPGSPESPLTLGSSWAPLAPGSPESPVTAGSHSGPVAPGSPESRVAPVESAPGSAFAIWGQRVGLWATFLAGEKGAAHDWLSWWDSDLWAKWLRAAIRLSPLFGADPALARVSELVHADERSWPTEIPKLWTWQRSRPAFEVLATRRAIDKCIQCVPRWDDMTDDLLASLLLH